MSFFALLRTVASHFAVAADRRRLAPRLVRFGAFAVLAGPALPAQVAPPPSTAEPPETIELSPFVVSAETDRGYVATSTLAGGRTRMELRDVASQVSVFTAELMKDLGATNLEEVLLYSSNTESYLDFNNASAAGFGVFRNTNPNRSRGLAGVSQTRNGFPTGFESDNYNVDRLSLISGPNALLFGMGSPAGLSDSGLNRAQFTRTKGSLGLRLDSEGSRRTTLDCNAPLVRDRLALRVDGVHDHREYWLKPSEYRNERFFLALAVRPTRATTVNVSSEWLAVVNQRAATQLPSDAVSLWLDRGSVPYDNAPNRAVGATNPLFRQIAKSVFVYGNAAAPGVANYVNSAQTRAYYDAVGFPNTPASDAGTVPPLTRPGLVPDDVNWFGLTRATQSGGSTQTATLEQRVGRDFFAELAVNQETITNREGGLLAGNANGVSAPSYTIYADANRNTPDGLAPNPNFGRFYVEGNGGAGYTNERSEESRLTLSYDLRLAERRDRWRWLGVHRFMAMGSLRDTASRSQGNEALVVGTPSFLTGAALTNLGASGRRFSGRYYLDQPGRGNRFGPEKLQNTVFGPWTFTDPATGRDFQVYTFDHPAGSNQVPSLARQRILSRALADTAAFWEGRLVLLAGWREDRTRTKGVLPADAVANSMNGMFMPIGAARFNSVWESFSTGQSMSYGAVLHPWTSKWLSLHYNRSANYSPPTAFFDPFDRPISGSSGRGEDCGVRVELPDGKATARLNFFRNSQVGFPNYGQVQVVARAAYDVELQMEALNPTMPRMGMNGSRARLAYADVLDFDAQGLDLDLTANPTRNWRVFANVGRQVTVNSNTAQALAAWFKARLPVWQSYPSWSTARMPTGALLINESFQTNVYNAFYYDLALKNGSSVENQRQWRGNLTTNYRFASGRLQGLAVGGGARYRSRAKIGYPLKTISPTGGQTLSVTDLDHPFYAADELTWDALLRYEFRLPSRVTCRVQLNVRNVLDANRRVPAAAYSNGAVSRYFRQEPRTGMLETTFDF